VQGKGWPRLLMRRLYIKLFPSTSSGNIMVVELVETTPY